MRMRQHIAFQRIESAVIFIASTYIYFDSGFSVVAYVLLLFAFDVSTRMPAIQHESHQRELAQARKPPVRRYGESALKSLDTLNFF